MAKLEEASNIVLNIENANKDALIPKTSKALRNASPGTDSSDNEARKRRADAAATHRAKVMAQMNKMQKQFMEKNAVEIMDTDAAPETALTTSENTARSQLDKNITTGMSKTQPHYENHLVTCILCQEEQLSWGEETKDVLIMASYITKGSVLSQFDTAKVQDSNSYCSNSQIPLRFGCCPSLSSCGHFMHAKCYQKFFDSLVTKARDQLFRHILNYDVDRNEYLCPICERLCNNILPVLPPVTKYLQSKTTPNSDLEKWTRGTKEILSEKYLDEPNGGASSAFPNLIEDIVRLVLKKPNLPLKDAPSFPKLSEQLRNMSNAFANNTYSKSLSTFPSEEDARMIHLNLQSLIVSLHLSQCGADNTVDQVFLEMKNREVDTLRSLTRLCLMMPFTFFQKASNPIIKCLRSNAIYILSVLLKNDIQDKNFNDFDAFGLLVFCVASYPALTYPDREPSFTLGKEDHNILMLCFIVNLVQIMVNYPVSLLEQSRIEKFGPIAQEDKCINQLAKKISSALGVEYITKTQNMRNVPNVSNENLSHILKKRLLRFLRCSALFFNLYTDVPFPEVSFKSGKISNLPTVYESLTTYLGIPNTFTRLIQTPGVSEIIDSLLANNLTKSFMPMEVPAHRRNLIELPENYLSLLSQADKHKCPNSVTKDSKSPALCLVCGTIVCSQSPCCELQLDRFKAGGCTVHARRCGGDNGIFLRLRKCQIILLSDLKRGAMLPAPYVDEYGECDEGLKRGNPLKLNRAMYEELNKVWISNDIPDKISRMFDTEVVTISARWYEL